jgi:hypothetical protein
MAGQKGLREFEPVDPTRNDLERIDVREGIAYHKHSSD